MLHRELDVVAVRGEFDRYALATGPTIYFECKRNDVNICYRPRLQ